MTDRIVSTPGTLGGKPRIAGHRIAVQHIVIWHFQMGMSVSDIVAGWELDPLDVQAALDYYEGHRSEIEQSIADEERWVDEMRTAYPSPLRKADAR